MLISKGWTLLSRDKKRWELMLIVTGLSLFLKDTNKKHSTALPIGSHRQSNWDAALPEFRPSSWEQRWNETEQITCVGNGHSESSKTFGRGCFCHHQTSSGLVPKRFKTFRYLGFSSREWSAKLLGSAANSHLTLKTGQAHLFPVSL